MCGWWWISFITVYLFGINQTCNNFSISLAFASATVQTTLLARNETPQEELERMKMKWTALEGVSARDQHRHDRVQKILSKMAGIYNRQPKHSQHAHNTFIRSVDSITNMRNVKGSHHSTHKPRHLRGTENVAGKQSKSQSIIAKTVWIHVIEASSMTNDVEYIELLFNTLCHEMRFNIKSIVYILDSGESALDKENTSTIEAQLKQFSPYIEILSYPTELFWSFIANKTQPIARKSKLLLSDYLGDVPSFSSFGALVMLVPVYEVLLQGYNVIYSDVDIGYTLRDPVPLLMRGLLSPVPVDFAVSQESRHCDLPSNNPHADWNKVEANSGLMVLRASSRGIDFYQRWLQSIVNSNVKNDQKMLKWNLVADSVGTNSCNLPVHSTATTTRVFTSSTNNTSFRYCFLNELAFQNGKTQFLCPTDDKIEGGSYATYVLGMVKFGQSVIVHKNTLKNETETQLSHGNLNNHNSHNSHIIHKNSEKVYFPVAIHANYCENKTECLHKYSVWLVYKQYTTTLTKTIETNSSYTTQHYMRDNHYKRNSTNSSTYNDTHSLSYNCKKYDFKTSYYAKQNWSTDIAVAQREYKQYIHATEKYQSNVVFRYSYDYNSSFVHYKYCNNTLHRVYNTNKLSKTQVVVMTDPLFTLLPHSAEDLTGENGV